MTQPPAPTDPARKSVQDLLLALESRSFRTYKNRVQAHERIQARGRAWNTALVALSTATTISAVGLIVDGAMYGNSSEALMVAFAVLGLSISLVVTSVDYPGRAVKLENSYKEIQDLSSRVQSAMRVGHEPSYEEYSELYAEYSDLVRHSENHTSADDERQRGVWGLRRLRSELLTLLPYATLILPAWIALRFAGQVLGGVGQ